MSSPEVRQERTGWRDEGLSRRHRTWGWDCPAVDIDFLLIEYDKAEPKAIIEYKSVEAEVQSSKHPSYVALCKVASAAGLPLFAVRYSADYSWWRVMALNALAVRALKGEAWALHFSEADYVEWLYELRGRSNAP